VYGINATPLVNLCDFMAIREYEKEREVVGREHFVVVVFCEK
jgi:hypothetical protein